MGLFRNRRRDRRPDREQLYPPLMFPLPAFADSERLVSEGTVLGTPAAAFCLERICNAIGEMAPMRVVDDPDGHVRSGPAPPILRQPWASMRPTEYVTMMVRSLILRGNFYAVPVDIDDLALPGQLVPLHPDHVRLQWNEGAGRADVYVRGRLYTGPLFHVAGPRMPGDLTGMGVVERFRRTHAIAGDQDAFESNNLRTGGVPTMVVRFPGKMDTATSTQAEAIETRWQARFGGAVRKPLFVPDGWQAEKLSFTPTDLEFLEGRRFTVAEMALMFGFDPSYLGAAMASSGATQTYANVQDRNADLVRYTYGPWATMLEEAFTELLPVGQAAQFNADALLRLTTAQRWESYKTAIEAGWLTPDEVREREGLDPLPTPAPTTPPPAAGQEANNDG